MLTNFFKSILHNVGVLFVGFIVAFVGLFLDALLQAANYLNPTTFSVGLIFLAIGFAIRVWATYYFYKSQMKVISLKPQKKLLTKGPYQFSRNPLYLGGNIFIFYGASFVLGSPAAIFITTLGIFLTDHMIKREEKQLEKKFGKEWINYTKKVRRWI